MTEDLCVSEDFPYTRSWFPRNYKGIRDWGEAQIHYMEDTMDDLTALRLLYEIMVTAPATRSQGWRGTLYGKDGQPLNVEPGKTAKTPVGEFKSVPPANPWTPCGMIHTDMLSWMEEHEGNSVLEHPISWLYRLYVTAEGSKNEGYRGEVLIGGNVVEPGDDKKLKAPMGTYIWVENVHSWGPHGWFHESWPQSRN